MLALCHEHYRSWQDVCRECETFLLKLYKCELHSRCTVWHWRRYVMEKFNLPSDQAHTYVLTRRHCISINEGFRNQIRYLGTWRHRLHLKKTHRLEVAKSLHTVRAHTHTCLGRPAISQAINNWSVKSMSQSIHRYPVLLMLFCLLSTWVIHSLIVLLHPVYIYIFLSGFCCIILKLFVNHCCPPLCFHLFVICLSKLLLVCLSFFCASLLLAKPSVHIRLSMFHPCFLSFFSFLRFSCVVSVCWSHLSIVLLM